MIRSTKGNFLFVLFCWVRRRAMLMLCVLSYDRRRAMCPVLCVLSYMTIRWRKYQVELSFSRIPIQKACASYPVFGQHSLCLFWTSRPVSLSLINDQTPWKGGRPWPWPRDCRQTTYRLSAGKMAVALAADFRTVIECWPCWVKILERC